MGELLLDMKKLKLLVSNYRSSSFKKFGVLDDLVATFDVCEVFIYLSVFKNSYVCLR